MAAIAEALKVGSKSSSKTTSKTKKLLEKSDDDDDKKKKTTKKDDDDSDEDADSEKTKKAKKDDESDGEDEKAVKKSSSSTKKTSSTKKKEASVEDDSKEDEDDTSIAVDRKLNDKDSESDKDDEEDDKDDEKSDDKDDEKDDDKDDDKDDEKKDSKDSEKDDEKDDEKEDSDEKSAVKDDLRSDDMEGEIEDEKDALMSSAKDEEKSDDKDDEKSDEKDDENSDDKDDEKSDDKDDEDTKGETKEKDDEDEKSDEKSDDKDDESEEDKEKDSKQDDDTVSGEGDAGGVASLGSRTSAGRQSNSAIGGMKPTLGKLSKHPGAGAQKAQLKERDMDRWKQIMEQRKKLIEKNKGKGFLRPASGSTRFKAAGPGGKVKMNTPGSAGSTKVMRANTPGTTEFEKRKKEILARIEKAKKAKGGLSGLFSKKKAEESDLKKSKRPFQKDIKKPGLVRKAVEKLPGLRKMVSMTPEEELILDASRSFITGLKHGIFMSNDELPVEKKVALQSWLELISVALPPEWGLHALIDDLLNNIDTVTKSNVNMQKVLYKHPLHRQRWSKSCDKMGGGGFSCGMWKLFHIVTLGIAEHHGGQNLVDAQMVEADTRTFSPADAADTIREYMANFFGCDDCRTHFLKRYDSCDFRRCDRLTDEIESASPDDWKQLSLWMWEIHNDVNIRVSNKKMDNLKKHLAGKHLQGAQSLNVRQTEESEIKVLWPSLEDCVVCFDDSGKWNEDSVFEFLERTYWDAPDAKFDRLLTTRKLEGEDPSGGGIVWIMMLIALGIVWNLRRHLTNVSFHKHIQMPTSVMGVGNKLGDAVAGKKRTA